MQQQFADGNAFDDIVKSYSTSLLGTAMYITKHRQTAEDIVQETFLRLWKNRLDIIPYNIGGWLHRVATNLAYKHIKKEAARNSVHSNLGCVTEKWHTDVEERLVQKENHNALHTALSLLPKRQQAVYWLSREQGLSRHQISNQLNISPSTVKNHLTRAVQFMKEHVQTCTVVILFLVVNNISFFSDGTKTQEKDLYKRAHIEELKSLLKTTYVTDPENGKFVASLLR